MWNADASAPNDGSGATSEGRAGLSRTPTGSPAFWIEPATRTERTRMAVSANDGDNAERPRHLPPVELHSRRPVGICGESWTSGGYVRAQAEA